MKLEKIVKETGRFVLVAGLTASVVLGAFIGARYLNFRYETKLKEKVQRCIEEEEKYVSNIVDIEYFGSRIGRCIDNSD